VRLEEKQLLRFVKLSRQNIRKLQQAVVPFAGIVHFQNGGADVVCGSGPDGKGHGDPGSPVRGLIHQNGAAVPISISTIKTAASTTDQ